MKKFLGIIVPGLLLSSNAYARVSIFYEDSGYSSSGDFFTELMALIIVVVIPFGIMFI